MRSNIGHIFNSLSFILALAIFSSCSAWHEAQAVIAEADSLDQNEHVLYSDTTALSQAISTLDNPIGRLLYADQLGKAYYYLGRNFSNEGAIAEAAAQYIEADRLQISDPLYRGRINSCMAHIAKQNESDSLALVFFERSNQAFKESGEDWYYAHTLLDVSEYNAYLHNYHKADSVLQIAQSYALDSFYLARFYETKGLYFYEQLQYDSALHYFHQALSLWEYEEDKFYTYKKLMQVYLDMDDHASALPYAQIIVEQSADPNDLVNAYYCLMQDAKAHGDINKLSTYAHARQDANELLMQSVGNYNGAQTLLEEHLANPYPYRWAWITLLCLIVACLLLVIAIVLHRRYTARRLQVAHHQIEDLSISAQISDIRATYPRPRKQWNDYNELKKDLEFQLHDWLSQLETYQLSNRENVFCTYMLLYPNASLEDLADWMHYSATGVSTFKRRIAQKIGIPTRELYHFLHEMLQSEK
jgi:tetratricopeptide (TPR) repeat protein